MRRPHLTGCWQWRGEDHCWISVCVFSELLHQNNVPINEEKLHLVERFLLLKKDVTAIEAELKRIKTSEPDADVSEMEQIITHMREMI